MRPAGPLPRTLPAVSDWDDDAPGRTPQQRMVAVVAIVVVAALLLSTVSGFVYALFGGAPALVTVVLFLALIAVGYLFARDWIRRQIEGSRSSTVGTPWSDRR